MASLGHVVFGLAAGRAHGGTSPRRLAITLVVFGLLALLPDADLALVALGVRDWTFWGHRGFSHSIAFAAAVAALGTWLSARCAWPLPAPPGASGSGASVSHAPTRAALLSLFAYLFVVVGSHGWLDAITYGGRGIPFLWPFSEARFQLPWRPLPAAPKGLRFLGLRGLQVATLELVYFLPLLAFALWPRRKGGQWAVGPWVRLLLLCLLSAACLVVTVSALRGTPLTRWLEQP